MERAVRGRMAEHVLRKGHGKCILGTESLSSWLEHKMMPGRGQRGCWDRGSGQAIKRLLVHMLWGLQ